MKKRFSKLTAMLVLVLAFSLGLVGCGGDEESTATETEATEAAEVETEASQQESEEESEEETDEAEESEETSGGPVQGGNFVVAITNEPSDYNPNASNASGNYRIAQNIFNRLVKINGNDEVVADLAKEWEFLDDGSTLRFYLNEATWHDGEACTAEDVKWTFDTILAEEGFASSSLKDIVEINVEDDYTVDFVLEGPNAGILGAIAWQGTFIMPEHIYAGTDWLENEANQNPVGTGPFKFVEHVPGDQVVTERNDDYFGQVPYLDKVTYTVMPDGTTAYQAWLAGEIDEGGSVPQEDMEELANDPDYQAIMMDWPNKSYFCFNMQEGRFTDPLLREAVLYGIDLDEIFERIYKGIGEQQEYFIPWQYDWAINEESTSPERDVEKARALIEEAGYEADEDGIYFETTIDTFPGWDEAVPVFQEQFEEFGIKLNHNSMDDPTYDQKVLVDQDFELTCLGGYVGPDISAIGNRLGTGGFMNYGLYSSEEMDALLEEGVRTVDPDERAEVYKEVQELQREDLPLVYFRDMYAIDIIKSYVNGHPASDEAKEVTSEHEYTYVWLENQ